MRKTKTRAALVALTALTAACGGSGGDSADVDDPEAVSYTHLTLPTNSRV